MDEALTETRRKDMIRVSDRVSYERTPFTSGGIANIHHGIFRGIKDVPVIVKTPRAGNLEMLKREANFIEGLDTNPAIRKHVPFLFEEGLDYWAYEDLSRRGKEITFDNLDSELSILDRCFAIQDYIQIMKAAWEMDYLIGDPKVPEFFRVKDAKRPEPLNVFFDFNGIKPSTAKTEGSKVLEKVSDLGYFLEEITRLFAGEPQFGLLAGRWQLKSTFRQPETLVNFMKTFEKSISRDGPEAVLDDLDLVIKAIATNTEEVKRLEQIRSGTLRAEAKTKILHLMC